MATSGDTKPDVPRPGVLGILKTLLKIENLFGPIFDEEIWFIGSISKVPSGERTWSSVDDVDISIVGKHLAEDFWKLLKALLERGIRPVWDVCEVPGDLVDFVETVSNAKGASPVPDVGLREEYLDLRK